MNTILQDRASEVADKMRTALDRRGDVRGRSVDSHVGKTNFRVASMWEGMRPDGVVTVYADIRMRPSDNNLTVDRGFSGLNLHGGDMRRIYIGDDVDAAVAAAITNRGNTDERE